MPWSCERLWRAALGDKGAASAKRKPTETARGPHQRRTAGRRGRGVREEEKSRRFLRNEQIMQVGDDEDDGEETRAVALSF